MQEEYESLRVVPISQRPKVDNGLETDVGGERISSDGAEAQLMPRPLWRRPPASHQAHAANLMMHDWVRPNAMSLK